MSNQAIADSDGDSDSFAGQADAGPGDNGSWEGRASEPGSATPHTPGPTADGTPSAGSGREAAADVLDEITDRDSYLTLLDSINLDELPLDATADSPLPVAPDSGPAATAPDSDEDFDADDGDNRPKQFRLRPTSDLDARVFALMKSDPSMGLETAMDLARASLGLPARGQDDPEPEAMPEDDPESLLPPSADAIEEQIRDLRRQKIAAKKDYDVDREAELEEQLLALEEQLPLVRERDRLAYEADAAFNQAQQAAWSHVVAAYPQADDETGAFAMLMLKVDDDLRASGDPLYDDPNKALAIADHVAGLLQVARVPAQPAPARGRSLPAPASSRPSVPAARPGPAAMSPASGSARTAADSPTQLEVDIARADTPEAYERLKERVLAGV